MRSRNIAAATIALTGSARPNAPLPGPPLNLGEGAWDEHRLTLAHETVLTLAMHGNEFTVGELRHTRRKRRGAGRLVTGPPAPFAMRTIAYWPMSPLLRPNPPKPRLQRILTATEGG